MVPTHPFYVHGVMVGASLFRDVCPYTFIMLPPSWSCSMYPITAVNARKKNQTTLCSSLGLINTLILILIQFLLSNIILYAKFLFLAALLSDLNMQGEGGTCKHNLLSDVQTVDWLDPITWFITA